MRQSNYRKTFFAILVVVIILPLCGCGDGRPTRVPYSGQIFINDQPLTYGFIQVMPTDARAASGEIGKDGRFTLTTFEPNDGVVPGTHPVAIMAGESLSEQKTRWHAPKLYTDAKKSGLTITVDGPTDSARIDLDWGKGKPFVETMP